MFDWNGTYTEETFNQEFTTLKFKGPGIYATQYDTILVKPNICNISRLYQVYVWNAQLQDTILDFIAKAPLHADLRTAAPPTTNEGTDI